MCSVKLSINEMIDNIHHFRIIKQGHVHGDILNQHFHEFVEIAFVISGKGINRLEDEDVLIKENDLFWINENVNHQIVMQQGDEPMVLYNIMFAKEFLKGIQINSEIFRKAVENIFYKPNFMLVQKSKLKIYIDKMYEEYQQGKAGNIEIIKFMMGSLIVEIYREMNKVELKRDSINYKIVQKAIEMGFDYYNQKIDITEICNKFYISTTQFSKIFKRQTGHTFTEYIQNVRLHFAKKMLCESNMSINEICEEIGYSDYSYFYRLFKRTTGMSPMDYRQNKQ